MSIVIAVLAVIGLIAVRYASFDPPPRRRPAAFWRYEAGNVPGEHATAMRCRK